MIDSQRIKARFSSAAPHLSERGRRLYAAIEAREAGYGGIAAVCRATGVAAGTIGRGLRELADQVELPPHRQRRAGGGRKPISETDPSLVPDLLALVESGERGDPTSPLRRTCKSLRRLADELKAECRPGVAACR